MTGDGEVEALTRHFDQFVEDHSRKPGGMANRRIIGRLLCQPINHFPDHRGDGQRAAILGQLRRSGVHEQIIEPGIRCRPCAMGHAARNPDTAVGRYDPDLVVRSTSDRPVQREDQLTLAMHMRRHFRLVICKVELPGHRRPIREVGVEDRDG
ncbi:hypothetical protein BK655_25370 [Pseudomonas brassicacearum]|nr:hypothetical protein A0U95_05455 [Pseudomonas brassicacearum]ROM75592.1 hypothetical protein BK655_25370 [Pseudomonas brassicacearum]